MIEDMITIFGINFFEIDYARLLSLTILFPAFIAMRKSSKNIEKRKYCSQDKILFIYLGYLFILHLQSDTYINVLRYYILYPFLGVFLLYYVISRSLKTVEEFHDAMMALVIACMVLSIIAVFECGKHWLLYT